MLNIKVGSKDYKHLQKHNPGNTVGGSNALVVFMSEKKKKKARRLYTRYDMLTCVV